MVTHNTSANTINSSFGVYNAQTGLRLGTYTTSIAPNSQRIVSVGNLEAASGISPEGVYHYNIKADTSFTGYLQHLVNNRGCASDHRHDGNLRAVALRWRRRRSSLFLPWRAKATYSVRREGLADES